MTINRRQFLAGGGSLLAATAAGALWPPGDGDRRFVTYQPPVRYSAKGQLKTTLACYFAHYRTGGRNLYTRTYEGAVPGPTLRARPGDVLRLRIANQLPPNEDEGEPANINIPHHFNTTNLHTHGLHVSPAGNADNSLLEIEPGHYLDYRIEIASDHPGGTYWYHPHKHGSVFMQMGGGMAGALILDGELDRVPEVAAAQDLVMVINSLHVDENGNQFPTFGVSNGDNAVHTLNGQVTPTVVMAPGEVQRWRLIQAMPDKYAWVTLDGHEMLHIALDAIPFATPRMVDQLILSSGNRADVLVQAGEPGTYMLRLLANNIGNNSTGGIPDVDLARVVVRGARRNMDLPDSLPVPPQLKPILDSEIVRTRTVEFNKASDGFLVDGRPFDPDRIDKSMVINTAEEWRLTNLNVGEHPFHIHTNGFLVTHVNDAPIEPTWMDTVSVPGEGSVTIRSRFSDFTGKMVLHCHLIEHEDQGMMQLCQVVAAGDRIVETQPLPIVPVPGPDHHHGEGHGG